MLKINMRTKPFEKTLQIGNFNAPSKWGAYSF